MVLRTRELIRNLLQLSLLGVLVGVACWPNIGWANSYLSGGCGYGRCDFGINDQMSKLWPSENGNHAYRLMPVFLRV